MITTARLIAAGVQPTPARTMADAIAAACVHFDINTPLRQAAFVAQCIVESRGFQSLEENCWWTTPERLMKVFPMRVATIDLAQTLVRNPQAMANTCYAMKNGNGNVASGDGWRYRGRGAIQLTGRNNYSDAGIECGRPYLEQPDLVAAPADACLTAAWFWHARKCNALADSQQFDSITRAINGPGMVDRDLRKQLSQEGVRAFS